MERVYARSHSRITARAGETFALELEGNFTTGYQWRLEPDAAQAAGLRIVDQEMKPGGPGIGAGGSQRFRIQALSAGKHTLRAEYKRPWEATSGEQLVFEIDVQS